MSYQLVENYIKNLFHLSNSNFVIRRKIFYETDVEKNFLIQRKHNEQVILNDIKGKILIVIIIVITD